MPDDAHTAKEEHESSITVTDVEAGVSPAHSPRRQAAIDFIDLLLRKPLYAKVNGTEDYIGAVHDALDGNMDIDFDCYCPSCNQVTPWSLRKYGVRSSGGGTGMIVGQRYSQVPLPLVRSVNAVCLRRQHFHTYVLYVQGDYVQKIGQKPSMADIALGELKATPGLDPLDRKEIGRALGLFSHDTPLGAFVYLRRVFERMIVRAHGRYAERHGHEVENWNDLRMGERIAALSAELPGVVQSNYAVWGLLSKGIHELSDEDAETLFPLIKAVIFEMLGEEERHRQSAIQSEATRRALASAAAHFNSATPKNDAQPGTRDL